MHVKQDEKEEKNHKKGEKKVQISVVVIIAQRGWKNNKLYYNMNKTYSYNSVYTAEEGEKTRRRDG